MPLFLPIKQKSLLNCWRRMPNTLKIGGIIMTAYVLVALSAHLWVPYKANKLMVGPPFSPPSVQNWFGTDQLGRDVFSRVALGTQVDLVLAITATTIAILIGGGLGLAMGYLRGWIDDTVMRFIDMLISVPPLILALLILSGLGSSHILLVLTVGILFAPRIVRTARGAALSIVSQNFIVEAKSRGESVGSIVIREILPNAMGPLLVEFAIRSGFAVVTIGSLGYLGFGVKPPTPEWGLMISESRNAIIPAPWTVIFPGIAIAILVMALNLTTDGLSRILGHGTGPKK